MFSIFDVLGDSIRFDFKIVEIELVFNSISKVELSIRVDSRSWNRKSNRRLIYFEFCRTLLDIVRNF